MRREANITIQDLFPLELYPLSLSSQGCQIVEIQCTHTGVNHGYSAISVYLYLDVNVPVSLHFRPMDPGQTAPGCRNIKGKIG